MISKQQIHEQLEHHATQHDNSQKASNFNHNFLGKGNFSKFHAFWKTLSSEITMQLFNIVYVQIVRSESSFRVD